MDKNKPIKIAEKQDNKIPKSIIFTVVFCGVLAIVIAFLALVKPFENNLLPTFVKIDNSSDSIVANDYVGKKVSVNGQGNVYVDDVLNEDLQAKDFFTEEEIAEAIETGFSVEKVVQRDNPKVESLQKEDFSVNNVEVSFPLMHSEITDMGIVFPDVGKYTMDTVVQNYFCCSLRTKLPVGDGESVEVMCSFKNTSGKEQKLKDCDIVGLSIDLFEIPIEKAPPIAFPDGIKWGSSQEDLIAAYGEPDYTSVFRDGRQEMYWLIGENSIIKVKFDGNKMNSFFFHSARNVFYPDGVELTNDGSLPPYYKALEND